MPIFLALPLTVTLTVFLSLLILGAFIFEGWLVRRHELALKKYAVILLSVVSFLVLLGAVIGLVYLWDPLAVDHMNTLFTDFWSYVTGKVNALIFTGIVIFLWLAIIRIAKTAFARLSKKGGPMQKRRETIGKVSYSVTSYAVAIIALIVILAIWGVNVIPALAGLGIAGLVIGLGAQKFINDVINGFFIVFEHHFDVGDVIEVSGFKGTVIDIGLKTTKVQNWKGDIKILANGDISGLINYSNDYSVAIVDFGIAYKEDIQQTMDVLNQAFKTFQPGDPGAMLEAPTVIGTMNLADSSVVLRAIVKTKSEAQYGVERDLRKYIKATLDDAGIEIPFPQVVVHQTKD